MAKNSNILWQRVTLEGVTDDGGRIKLTANVESVGLMQIGKGLTDSVEVETTDDVDQVIEDTSQLRIGVTGERVEYVVSYFRRSATPEPMDRDDEAEETERRR